MIDEKTARLDAFARQIAEQRPQVGPHVAEFEQQLVTRFGELAPEGADQRIAGAAWMIVANLLGGASLPMPVAMAALGLAGQRLYAGDDVRQSMPCPHVYESGAACRHVAKGTSAEQLQASMAGHYATYHSAETWPPEPERIAVGAKITEYRPPVDDYGRATRPGLCARCGEQKEPFNQFAWGGFLCRDCVAASVAGVAHVTVPSQEARGIVGACRTCGKPVYSIGEEGELTGHITTDGIYCHPCYEKESALPDDEDDVLDPDQQGQRDEYEKWREAEDSAGRNWSDGEGRE